MSLIHGCRRSRSNQIHTRGFKPPQKGLGRPEIIRDRAEGSPTPGGQQCFLGEGDDPAEDRALQRKQKVQRLCAGDRRRLVRQAGGGAPRATVEATVRTRAFSLTAAGAPERCAQTQARDLVWPQ